MRTFYKLLLSAMTVGCVTSALHANTVLETGRYYCDFASEEDYNRWTVIDANGPDSGDYNYWMYTPSQQRATMKNGSNMDGDDWLISPSVTLEAGKIYSVKIRFAADYPCTFDLTYGSEATVEGQNSVSGAVRYDGEQYAAFKLPAEAAGGDFHIGIHAVTSKSDDGWLYIYSVDVTEDKDGSIDFLLVNSTTNEPISDVAMNLTNPTFRAQTVTTNSEGHASFGPLTPGDYTLTYSIDGFQAAEPMTVTVGDNENVAKTVEATPLVLRSVSGKVVDYLNRPIAGVNIDVNGSRSYSATTDDFGQFTIEEVRCPETYVISINRLLYQPYTAEFEISGEDLDLGDIQLDNFFGKPSNVTCDKTEAGAFVSWLAPVGTKEFKYDNGKYQGMHSVEGNYIDYVHFGVKFDEPLIVEEISWVVCELRDGLVDLAIYPLTPDGAISTVAAFEAKGVPSATYRWTPNMEWQKYHLETPVEMPYGCLVSIGHKVGGMNIALDYQDNWGPSYTGKNNLEEGWEYAYISNFLIRATGTVLTRDVTIQNRPAAVRSNKNYAPARTPMLTTDGISYKVWRFDSSAKDEPEWWTLLTGKTNGLYAIDKDFESLEQGEYIYAVQAINHDGTESEITMSEPMRLRMTTNLTVRVFTDTAIDFADGATVTLTNNETNDVFEGVVTDNTAKFADLPKGVYSMRVKRSGFSDAVYGSLYYNKNSEYTAYVDLALVPEAPFSLQATQADDSNTVILEWNKPTGIFDDFESMTDFEVNPAGDHGWTYADLDGSTTYGVAQCQQTPYPNMHAKMAFMAFNPYTTTPDISAYVQPYSGEKVLISVSIENGGRNNDYMFSPELNFDTPFTVRFQACAGFYGALGRERFMVGYTTEGTDPESVIWITTEPESVGGLWNEFSYTLPAEARHAVIRCVSDQAMFFMIDDLFIGRQEDDIFAMSSFRVYLDDELAGTTSNRAFAFTDLEEGKHLAKVQTVYQMADMSAAYSDFTELLFTVANTTTGINNVKTDELYSYSPATMTLTAGASAAEMTVYDMQGRIYGNGHEISFTPSEKGIYLVYVTTTDGRVVVRKLAI